MLAQILNQQCKLHGLSPRDVAEKVGISHTTIIRALKGVAVDLDTLLKLSDWMGVKPATLVNSMGSSPDLLPDKIAAVLEMSPRLADELSRVISEISLGNIPPQVLEDIASYAAYRLSLQVEK